MRALFPSSVLRLLLLKSVQGKWEERVDGRSRDLRSKGQRSSSCFGKMAAAAESVMLTVVVIYCGGGDGCDKGGDDFGNACGGGGDCGGGDGNDVTDITIIICYRVKD